MDTKMNTKIKPLWMSCTKAPTCWTWDVLFAAYANNPEILRRIKAAHATCGIWEDLPPFEE